MTVYNEKGLILNQNGFSTSLTFEEKMIELGQAFRTLYYWTSDLDAIQDFVVIAPQTSTAVYLRVDINTTVEAEYLAYPLSTRSDNGTLITPLRRNGNILYDYELEIYRDPTVTDTGDPSIQQRWGSGSKNGGAGGSQKSLLTTDAQVLLRIISRANGGYFYITILHEEVPFGIS